MQVNANFMFGDSMARFCADVDDMKKAAAGRMEADIMHMELPNQGRVSSGTCPHTTCSLGSCCISICSKWSVSPIMHTLADACAQEQDACAAGKG